MLYVLQLASDHPTRPTGGFIRRSPLRRAKAEREASTKVENQSNIKYVMWNLILAVRITHHFSNTDQLQIKVTFFIIHKFYGR